MRKFFRSMFSNFGVVNELLGFEIGDIKSGKKLHRVEVQGYQKGPVDRHGCPSHGIGLTPDERELWLCDGHNKAMHVFDNTVMPPKQMTTLPLRDQPGWITFSMDGRHAYPSTGEVFDVKTRERIAALDEIVNNEAKTFKVKSGEPKTITCHEQAHIVDVAPTLLALMAEIVPDEMDGRVLEEVIAPDFLSQNPVRVGPVEGFLLDALPRTASGKPHRRALVQRPPQRGDDRR